MRSKFATPISVHFLIHKDYYDIKEVRTYLYSLLCRDIEKCNTDGLDIPVFFHIGGGKTNIPKISNIDSEKQIIVPIIDENMFCDSLWNKYFDELIDKVHNDKNQYVLCPVSMFDFAFQIHDGIKDIQFIRLRSNSILDNKQEFQIRLFDLLIRSLGVVEENHKLKVFISHSKRDEDAIGKKRAELLRNYLHSTTKLNSFFDANDILDGENFGEKIKESIKNSIFVIVHSDTYSEREWCRIEVLESKYKRIPSIRIDCTTHYCNRVFPYMANIPSVRFNNNWEEVIALMLRTTLDWYYQKKYLSNLKRAFSDKNIEIEETVPELFSIFYHHKDHTSILYPEPPVGKEEIELFNKVCENKSFFTPMQLQTTGIDLKKAKIAISISEPSDNFNKPFGIEQLKDISIELARHLLAVNAHLVYGGDLRKTNNFVHILGELSYQYYESQHSEKDIKPFSNYFAWPIWKNVSKSESAFLIRNRINEEKCAAPKECPQELQDTFLAPNNPSNKLIWAHSLTKMRFERDKECKALVALGGRTDGYKGFVPGVIEEVLIAIQSDKPIYLIGAFGGAIGLLIDYILEDKSIEDVFSSFIPDMELSELVEFTTKLTEYKNIFANLKNKGLAALNNRLSNEDNIKLFTSTNITEIISIILKGIKQN